MFWMHNNVFSSSQLWLLWKLNIPSLEKPASSVKSLSTFTHLQEPSTKNERYQASIICIGTSPSLHRRAALSLLIASSSFPSSSLLSLSSLSFVVSSIFVPTRRTIEVYTRCFLVFSEFVKQRRAATCAEDSRMIDVSIDTRSRNVQAQPVESAASARLSRFDVNPLALS